jgi:hypothetical protein
MINATNNNKVRLIINTTKHWTTNNEIGLIHQYNQQRNWIDSSIQPTTKLDWFINTTNNAEPQQTTIFDW